MQLVGAVAAAAAENITSQAFGMDPHQHRFVAGNFTLDQGQVLEVVHVVLKGNRPEISAVAGGKENIGSPAHKGFVLQPVGDKVGDRAYLYAMFLGELLKLRHSGHGAVFVHDLADHAGRFQTCHARHVH